MNNFELMQKINKAMKLIEIQYFSRAEYEPKEQTADLVEAQTILFDVLQELRARER